MMRSKRAVKARPVGYDDGAGRASPIRAGKADRMKPDAVSVAAMIILLCPMGISR